MESLTKPSESPATAAALPRTAVTRSRPDRIILVYDGDSGLRALLLDVAKKAVGREECALCEITYGPLGKRRAWRKCEARLGVIIDELHRDQVPAAWEISRTAVPCVLGRIQEDRPFTLVTRAEIEACGGSIPELERRLVSGLAAHGAPSGFERLKARRPGRRRDRAGSRARGASGS